MSIVYKENIFTLICNQRLIFVKKEKNLNQIFLISQFVKSFFDLIQSLFKDPFDGKNMIKLIKNNKKFL